MSSLVSIRTSFRRGIQRANPFLDQRLSFKGRTDFSQYGYRWNGLDEGINTSLFHFAGFRSVQKLKAPNDNRLFKGSVDFCRVWYRLGLVFDEQFNALIRSSIRGLVLKAEWTYGNMHITGKPLTRGSTFLSSILLDTEPFTSYRPRETRGAVKGSGEYCRVWYRLALVFDGEFNALIRSSIRCLVLKVKLTYDNMGIVGKLSTRRVTLLSAILLDTAPFTS